MVQEMLGTWVVLIMIMSAPTDEMDVQYQSSTIGDFTWEEGDDCLDNKDVVVNEWVNRFLKNKIQKNIIIDGHCIYIQRMLQDVDKIDYEDKLPKVKKTPQF